MPLTDSFETIDPQVVIVNRETRQRRAIVTKDLEESIKKIGQIQPIVVDRQMVLVAGERRLQSCINLNLPVRIRYVEDLTPIERQVIELEENLKRQDLDWHDIIRTTGKIHALYQSLDPTWTATDTGEQLSLAQPTMSMYLRVWAEFDEPAIQAAGGIRDAFSKLRRRDQRAAGEALEELLDLAPAPESVLASMALQPTHLQDALIHGSGGPIAVKSMLAPKPPEVILTQSFLEWAPSYVGPKFNLIHCDFPYGIDHGSGPQARGAEPASMYADSAKVYWDLLECFCRNLDNFMSLSSHLMFWYSDKHRDMTMQVFADLAPSLKFNRYPLIWHKTDNAGISSDPRFTPRHVYETCLVARRSDRNLLQVKSDVYGCPIGPYKSGHPSAKPEPMLREFMAMFCDETTSLLDPTCGSGASLRAADSLGAKRVLGLEINEAYAGPARVAFRNARSLRGANKVIEGRCDQG